MEELYQVAEMKAIEWKFDNPQMANNFRPSVVFGNRFSEYKAFLDVFREQNYNRFCKSLANESFEILLGGPWNE